MKKQASDFSTSRRSFLAKITAGAATLGISSLIPVPLQAAADTPEPPAPVTAGTSDPAAADAWMKNNIRGKRKIVFDAPQPHEVLPFAWPKVFQLTNMATGTDEKDTSVVVVLRHSAIPYAMHSELWKKYNFGEVFKVEDPVTKAFAVRNAFWMPQPGDFKVPGLGEVEIGINQLQSKGVMFCVCDTAMTVFSAAVAENMKADAAAVKKEWIAGLLPGIQVVPSGVWAVGRAQDYGCAYCFAG